MKLTRPVTLSALLLGIALACAESGQDAPRSTAPREADRRTGLYRRDVGTDQLSEAQLADIEALESLGYAAGSTAATRTATGVITHAVGRAQPGLNLYVSAHAPEALLLDLDGEVLHRWHIDFEATWDLPQDPKYRFQRYWRRVHALENGDLLAIHEGLGMIRLDRDSRVVWKSANGAHHDLSVADNGDITTLTRRAHVLARIHPEHPVLEDFVTVLAPDGTVKREASILTALERSEFAYHLERRAPAGDILHTNTVEVLSGLHAERSSAFEAGNVLISIRELDLLAILDLEQEEIVWARTGDWVRQHQPSLLDSGDMLLFDNRGRGGLSRVIEFDPLTGEVRWSYPLDAADGLHSEESGSTQRLANGNTLISESERGRIIEVTHEGEIVWEFRSPHRAGHSDEFVAVLFELVRIPAAPHRAWLDDTPAGT